MPSDLPETPFVSHANQMVPSDGEGPSRLRRFRDSDLWWSFTHKPPALFSFAVLVLIVVAAFAAPLYEHTCQSGPWRICVRSSP
ncbi:hypothetical protein [Thalassorhabdomicrobium marinisediminis]|uniref:Oligopeptide transport permease C-like N-terminal domain-containing protein n=1 Tax=Thalassorhabdomicrobium marinisediminis TaxID=2170577 RepID=A0A2T7FTL0_9RHOB|nr:hypothetical protein [Thalassorhabdomicrobium marinisediminis]PVA05509.1 hypothetical protein DC363_14805 [Thalassorhabdomicrobium marinisediminis]